MAKKVFAIFIIFILSFSNLAFADSKVFIDPGHGGHDSGAVSYDNQFLEKDLNLETAKACIEELEKHGIKIYTSRTEDVFISLEDRSKMANEVEDLDLFVSIHHNAARNTNVNRGEVIYSVKEDDSQRLAECISKKLYDIGNAEVKIYNRYNGRGLDYYAVIRNTEAVSIIVEISFLTSKEGVSLVDTPEERRRNGILVAQGIMDYLGVDYSEQTKQEEKKQIKQEKKKQTKKEEKKQIKQEKKQTRKEEKKQTKKEEKKQTKKETKKEEKGMDIIKRALNNNKKNKNKKNKILEVLNEKK